MKRVASVLLLLCFLFASLGVTALAEETARYDKYTLSGTITGASEGNMISVFVLKEGYKMSDLASASGSVLDKVYYTNIFETGEGGAYSFDIQVPAGTSRAATCVLSCNGTVAQDTLRSFLVSSGSLTVIYASPTGKSGNKGTKESPYDWRTAKKKALTAAKTNDVDILMLDGKYDMMNSRIQFSDNDTNKGTGHRITFVPASKDDKPIVTSMKTVDHQYITKLTEGDIYNRLPESARGMVYKLDMKKAGFADEVPIVSSTTGETTGYYSVLKMNYAGETASHRSIDPPILYLNGKRQRVSQYPNEKTVAFDNQKNITGTNANGNPTLSYEKFIDQMDFGKWTTAREDAFLVGYVFDSYRTAAVKITDIDTTNKKITIDGTREFYYPNKTFNPRFGPRLAIVNLPEEMDIPGEYYFCTADKCIYYYAPYELTADDVFEMANDGRDSTGKWGYPESVFISGSENITFDGIEFYGSRFSRAIYVSNSSGIEFRNCTVHATAGAGMVIQGKNILVENCNIYDVGTNAVSIGSLMPVNKDVSVNGGNIVRNNHIYNYAQNPTYGYATSGIVIGKSDSKTVDGEYIVYKSLGDTAENNLIHASKFAGGLRASGLRQTIKRNEVYNLLQSTDDIGAIYIGRSLTEFGNDFTENYIHDYHSIANPRYSTMGIYWDDYMSGQTGTRNIVVAPGDPNSKTDLLGIRTIGYDNRIYSNTFVNINIGIGLSGRSPSTFTSQNSEWGLTNALSKYMPAEGYERRADMETLLSRINSTGQMIHMAKVENNLIVNCAKPITRSSNTDGRIYEYGTDNVHDNEENTYDMSIFVDPENQDYRVKKSAITPGTLSTVANEENFDMDWVGIQTKDKIPEADKSFKLMHPTKNETVTKDSVILTWEQGLFADEYEYVIATDSEFKNVVETGKTIETFVIPTKTFVEGNTYYWKVKAANTSRNMGSEWMCDKVESFTVGDAVTFEVLETKLLVADGTDAIWSLEGVEKFDLSYTVKNNAAASQDYMVIGALFTADGKFQQARVGAPSALANGQTATGKLRFSCAEALKDGYYVKLFVIDKPKTIKPISFINTILQKQ